MNTEKAQKVLAKLNRRNRNVSRLSDSKLRDRVLEELNRSTLDDVGPLGGDQGMKVLDEMNSLGDQQEQSIRESIPTLTVN